MFIAVSLRLRGFNKTREVLQRKLPRESPELARTETLPETIQRTCRMVKAATRYGPTGATCLEESLALWYLLRQQNIRSALRIGVRKSWEKLEAHAWVECEDMPLNETEALHRHYSVFAGEFSDFPGEKA